MSKLSRKEAEAHLAQNKPVIHQGRTLSNTREYEALPDDHPDDFHQKFHPDGTLTRPAMEAAIRAGGSVTVGGRVIDSIGDLPDNIAMASGNVERLEQERDRIGDEMKRLEQQSARVTQEIAKAKESRDAAAKEAKSEAKAEAKSEAKGKAASGATDYHDWHVDELHSEAAARNIDGRSSLTTKDQLVKALEKHDRDAAKASDKGSAGDKGKKS